MPTFYRYCEERGCHTPRAWRRVPGVGSSVHGGLHRGHVHVGVTLSERALVPFPWLICNAQGCWERAGSLACAGASWRGGG